MVNYMYAGLVVFWAQQGPPKQRDCVVKQTSPACNCPIYPPHGLMISISALFTSDGQLFTMAGQDYTRGWQGGEVLLSRCERKATEKHCKVLLHVLHLIRCTAFYHGVNYTHKAGRFFRGTQNGKKHCKASTYLCLLCCCSMTCSLNQVWNFQSFTAHRRPELELLFHDGIFRPCLRSNDTCGELLVVRPALAMTNVRR